MLGQALHLPPPRWVSWNNTCAEHAIKKFARFREEAAQSVKEEGLKEYLVLLSIYETCRYRGLSFFKFLRSKELDLETYRETKHPRGRRFSIETYPDEYIPPHMASIMRLKAASSGEERSDTQVDQEGGLSLGQGQPDFAQRG